jgi:hypothetical protein
MSEVNERIKKNEEGKKQILEKTAENFINISSFSNKLNKNSLHKNIRKKIEEMEKRRNDEDKLFDKINEKYKSSIEDLKNNILGEKKDEILNSINNVYLKFNLKFNKNISFVGDINNYLDIYKNFIRLMVLLLNKQDVYYLLDFMNKIMKKYYLYYDSFFVYFVNDIIKSSEKTGEDIIFYDIDISKIDNDEPRLIDHIYMFYSYFPDNFIKICNNINFVESEFYSPITEIDIKNKKIIVNYNNNNINIFCYLNYLIFSIIKKNCFDVFYIDIIKFIKNTLFSKIILKKINYLLLFFDIFYNINMNIDNFLLLGYTALPLGAKDDRLSDGNRKNTFFFLNTFNYGKINIMELYISKFLNFDLYKSSTSEDMKLIDNDEIYKKKFLYDILTNMCNFELEFEEKYHIQKNWKFSNAYSNYQEYIGQNNRSLNQNKRKLDYFYESFLKNVKNNFYNMEIFIKNKIGNINYIEYLDLLCKNNLKIFDIGPYFNLASYPILYTFKNNKYIDREIKYLEPFRLIQKFLEEKNQNFVNDIKKRCLISILELLNSKINNEKQNINLINYFYERIKINNRRINEKNKVDNIFNFIYIILRKKFNHFQISSFFYIFMSYNNDFNDFFGVQFKTFENFERELKTKKEYIESMVFTTNRSKYNFGQIKKNMMTEINKILELAKKLKYIDEVQSKKLYQSFFNNKNESGELNINENQIIQGLERKYEKQIFKNKGIKAFIDEYKKLKTKKFKLLVKMKKLEENMVNYLNKESKLRVEEEKLKKLKQELNIPFINKQKIIFKNRINSENIIEIINYLTDKFFPSEILTNIPNSKLNNESTPENFSVYNENELQFQMNMNNVNPRSSINTRKQYRLSNVN